jgi:predicted Zn finger-like uncharacterized protein
MLIVCPNCATSYLIEPGSLGAAGRTVRCARCKTTWFAGNTAKKVDDVSAFVDGVIAEAEAQADGNQISPALSASPPVYAEAESAHDDFGAEPPSLALPPSLPAVAAFAPLAMEGDPPSIADAPSLVPPEHPVLPAASSAELDAEDMESFVARRERLKAKRKTKKRSSRWTAIALVLFAINVALVGARNEVVRYLPQTASLFAAIGLPVNLRNLKFDNVRVSKETNDGITALMIEGTIASTSHKAAEVPRLRFAARNAAGREVYTWTALPARSVLGPDETLPFSSRLVSPPADAVDIMVRFFTAQDAAAAGTK